MHSESFPLNARTIEVKVFADDHLHEFLIAELSELDFESFVEGDGYVLAYIRPRDWDDVARETVERWLSAHGLPVRLEERVYEPENWNRLWEETVRPVVVGNFVVKPTWSDVPEGADDRIVLEIDPKMSFGTGYHESTRLALILLPEGLTEGDHVLDAGTGTGILAIAAARLGARSVHAFDIDPWSFANAQENVYLNHVADRVTVAEGSLEVVPDEEYDLILANINRSALLEMMPDFGTRLSRNGTLIMSGLLSEDADLIRRSAAHWGLTAKREVTEGSWWAIAVGHEGV